MNSVEPSGLLYQRLSSLDPDSASKIMGFVLIHGPSDADMMSLATAPDVVLHQLICRGKSYSRILTAAGAGAASLHSPTYGEDGGSDGTLPDTLSFLGERSKSEDLNDLGSESTRMFHKRSFSQSDVFSGGGCRPRIYYVRGFCKNGSSCNFVHSLGFGDDSGVVGDVAAGLASSPVKIDVFEQELLRARANQQQRLALASQIMSNSSHPYSKFFTDSPRSKAGAAMMMGEELQKLGQCRSEFPSGSRQIYLTFPADSTFREEDVSNYFSLYGPVQDVRIPYQQKRMFGFVTFVHPETVKIILAEGNPHFVCDSRVLVKPYKEKGKAEKKHLMTRQQLERGDFSSCLSPHGVDIRDFDVPIGPRMFYNNNSQDLSMRRKLEEQAEFQQALEMQSRKMANLHLLDLNSLPRRHPFSPNQCLSPADVMSSPTHHPLLSPNHMRSMGPFNPEAFEENTTTPTLSLPPHALVNRQASLEGYSNANNCNEYTTSNTDEIRKLPDSADNASLYLVFPDTLDDAIPPRSAAPSRRSLFSSAILSMNENAAASSSQFSSNSSTIGSSACLSNAALPKSRFLDDPSFGSVGNQAIEM